MGRKKVLGEPGFKASPWLVSQRLPQPSPAGQPTRRQHQTHPGPRAPDISRLLPMSTPSP